jgi:8-oxo-dGTP pyrophosphatase MutT (NUDIX family)
MGVENARICAVNEKIQDAATLILVDFKKGGPEILMGRRSARHTFMPDKFVFPGGRLEASDRNMNIASPLDLIVESKLVLKARPSSPTKARAMALAAIRETYEETGIMIGDKDLGLAPSFSTPPWDHFSRRGIWPSLEQLCFIARAVTPSTHKKRFDTRFFLTSAAHIAHTEPGFTGPEKELTELVWVKLEKAKELDIPFITGRILDEISLRLANGLRHDLPVPFFREYRGRYVRHEI